jgi:hypothetical protein
MLLDQATRVDCKVVIEPMEHLSIPHGQEFLLHLETLIEKIVSLNSVRSSVV